MRRTVAKAVALVALASISNLWVATHLSAGSEAPAATAIAARTATFAVENMTCALCPVTVKTAIEGVEGVQSVKIDFTAKTASVRFDPSVTTTGAIAAASTDAGYPAAVRE